VIINMMSEPTLISEVTQRLTRAFPTVPPETIAEVVPDVHVKFDGAPLREFVPLFVERRARSALDQLSVSYQS
jgi:hypothetical protein